MFRKQEAAATFMFLLLCTKLLRLVNIAMETRGHC